MSSNLVSNSVNKINLEQVREKIKTHGLYRGKSLPTIIKRRGLAMFFASSFLNYSLINNATGIIK
jgi:hypothetical protein